MGPIRDLFAGAQWQPYTITASSLPLQEAIYCKGIYVPTRLPSHAQPLSMPRDDVLSLVHDGTDPRPPYALRGRQASLISLAVQCTPSPL